MATEQNTPLSLEELKKLRRPFKAIVLKHEKVSALDKLALWITQHVGSMGFFLIIFIWTVIWLSWNILAPAAARFDPYPAFVLWLFISNLIQLFLMPLIMIGQNLQSNQADARSEADYEVNKQAEREIETILAHLENQNKLIIEILDSIKPKS
jgi:uncharacterized membrane protein